MLPHFFYFVVRLKLFWTNLQTLDHNDNLKYKEELKTTKLMLLILLKFSWLFTFIKPSNFSCKRSGSNPTWHFHFFYASKRSVGRTAAVGWALVAHAFSGCLRMRNAWAASAHPTYFCWWVYRSRLQATFGALKPLKSSLHFFNCFEAVLSGSLCLLKGYLKAETACVRNAHTTQMGYAGSGGTGLYLCSLAR